MTDYHIDRGRDGRLAFNDAKGMPYRINVSQPINRDALLISIIRYVNFGTDDAYAEMLFPGSGKWERFEALEILRDPWIIDGKSELVPVIMALLDSLT